MLPSISDDSCQICGQKSIGNNFGARSCRACAAFFRRNALNHRGNKLRCEKGDCEPIGGGKFFCKKCRLEKCIEMGMDAKKFQLDRDVLRTASNFNSMKKRYYEIGLPQSMAQFLGRPSAILCCEPEKASRVKTILDVSPVIRAVETIFREALQLPHSLDRDGLSKMTQKYEKMRPEVPSVNTVMVELITKEHALRIWEDAFVDTATWLTGWDEFRILPEKIQMLIVKCGWLLWSKLEHLAQTADYMRRLLASNSLLIVGHDIGIDVQKVDFDHTWATNYSKEQAKEFFIVDLNGNFANITKWLIDLDPTRVELNYMLCHVCLYMAGKRNPEISAITDKLLDLQADCLHNYYKTTLKCVNYSGRIAKMMRINNLLFRDMWERNERNQMIMLFDLLCFEFSDMEMFRGN